MIHVRKQSASAHRMLVRCLEYAILHCASLCLSLLFFCAPPAPLLSLPDGWLPSAQLPPYYLTLCLTSERLTAGRPHHGTNGNLRKHT